MILLTGATGYLGTLVLARLLEDADAGPDIVCPVRAPNRDAARSRTDGTLARIWNTPGDARRRRVHAVPCDLTGEPEILQLDDVTHVLHCAAAVQFDLPLANARAVNVEGTRAVLDLARRAPRLQRMVHVSTAYVAGRHEGVFLETDLLAGQALRNTYEQSKLEAEILVGARSAELPVVVARPSIVVGEAQTGWTTTFNVLYPPLRAYSRGVLRSAPAAAHGIVDIVTGDYVADALIQLLNDPRATGTYNLVAGAQALSVDALRLLAASAFERDPVELVSPAADAGSVFEPYFDVRCRFDDARARALLGPAGIHAAPVADVFEQLMAFAQDAAWGKRAIVREQRLALR